MNELLLNIFIESGSFVVKSLGISRLLFLYRFRYKFSDMNISICLFYRFVLSFFCEAITAGIPLRGCISTGMATMNQHDSIYFGRPLVEAARGETA